jgi:hypothetical protein
MTGRDERTSARVARIAARVLAAAEITVWTKGATERNRRAISPSDIRALATFYLNQAPSKPVPPRAHADIQWNKPAAKNHKPIARK